MAATDLLDVLVAQLTDAETAWSIGSFGAIAEFARDADEPAAWERHGEAISVVTRRGGLRIEAHPALRLIASESLTAQSWSQRVAVCLPEATAAMNRRGVLTEIGADRDALRAEDRTGIIFDLGLGALQIDACVRFADAESAAALRPWVGQSVFAAGSGAMRVMLAANPHRVFLSRVGRAEVFQPIPPPDGKSPEGPHTHVLPKLLRHRRTHAATEPLPEGWIPCAHFYPPHPLRDAMGRPRPFQAARHAGFQALLDCYGVAELVETKRHAVELMQAGEAPSALAVPAERFARASLRIALRQWHAANGISPALAAWLSAFDRFDPDAADDSLGEHPCTA